MKTYLASMILCNVICSYPVDTEYCYQNDPTGFNCVYISSDRIARLDAFNYFFFGFQFVEVAGQMLALIYFKYKNQLFGRTYLKNGELLLPLILACMNFSFIRLAPGHIYSGCRNVISLLNDAISVIHAANLSYYEDFFIFRTFTAEAKKKINKVEKGMKCGICWDSVKKLKLDEIINPCKNQEHIFCKQCFCDWITNKHQVDETPQYICELCRNPAENAAITFSEEIIAPTLKETTFKLCKSWHGMLILGLFAINLYSVLTYKL